MLGHMKLTSNLCRVTITLAWTNTPLVLVFNRFPVRHQVVHAVQATLARHHDGPRPPEDGRVPQVDGHATFLEQCVDLLLAATEDLFEPCEEPNSTTRQVYVAGTRIGEIGFEQSTIWET